MQMATQRYLDSSNEWKADSYTAAEVAGSGQVLDYRYRVKCDEHYYGDNCANLCRPRDDNFGHYTCSESGDKVCLNGWSGEYCTKGTVSCLVCSTTSLFPCLGLTLVFICFLSVCLPTVSRYLGLCSFLPLSLVLSVCGVCSSPRRPCVVL